MVAAKLAKLTRGKAATRWSVREARVVEEVGPTELRSPGMRSDRSLRIAVIPRYKKGNLCISSNSKHPIIHEFVCKQSMCSCLLV